MHSDRSKKQGKGPLIPVTNLGQFELAHSRNNPGSADLTETTGKRRVTTIQDFNKQFEEGALGSGKEFENRIKIGKDRRDSSPQDAKDRAEFKGHIPAAKFQDLDEADKVFHDHKKHETMTKEFRDKMAHEADILHWKGATDEVEKKYSAGEHETGDTNYNIMPLPSYTHYKKADSLTYGGQTLAHYDIRQSGSNGGTNNQNDADIQRQNADGTILAASPFLASNYVPHSGSSGSNSRQNSPFQKEKADNEFANSTDPTNSKTYDYSTNSVGFPLRPGETLAEPESLAEVIHKHDHPNEGRTIRSTEVFNRNLHPEAAQAKYHPQDGSLNWHGHATVTSAIGLYAPHMFMPHEKTEEEIKKEDQAKKEALQLAREERAPIGDLYFDYYHNHTDEIAKLRHQGKLVPYSQDQDRLRAVHDLKMEKNFTFGPDIGLYKGRDDIMDMMLFHSPRTKSAKDRYELMRGRPSDEEAHESLYDANPDKDVITLKAHRCLTEHKYRIRRLLNDKKAWDGAQKLRKELGDAAKDLRLKENEKMKRKRERDKLAISSGIKNRRSASHSPSLGKKSVSPSSSVLAKTSAVHRLSKGASMMLSGNKNTLKNDSSQSGSGGEKSLEQSMADLKQKKREGNLKIHEGIKKRVSAVRGGMSTEEEEKTKLGTQITTESPPPLPGSSSSTSSPVNAGPQPAALSPPPMIETKTSMANVFGANLFSAMEKKKKEQEGAMVGFQMPDKSVPVPGESSHVEGGILVVKTSDEQALLDKFFAWCKIDCNGDLDDAFFELCDHKLKNVKDPKPIDPFGDEIMTKARKIVESGSLTDTENEKKNIIFSLHETKPPKFGRRDDSDIVTMPTFWSSGKRKKRDLPRAIFFKNLHHKTHGRSHEFKKWTQVRKDLFTPAEIALLFDMLDDDCCGVLKFTHFYDLLRPHFQNYQDRVQKRIQASKTREKLAREKAENGGEDVVLNKLAAVSGVDETAKRAAGIGFTSVVGNARAKHKDKNAASTHNIQNKDSKAAKITAEDELESRRLSLRFEQSKLYLKAERVGVRTLQFKGDEHLTPAEKEAFQTFWVDRSESHCVPFSKVFLGENPCFFK